MVKSRPASTHGITLFILRIDTIAIQSTKEFRLNIEQFLAFELWPTRHHLIFRIVDFMKIPVIYDRFDSHLCLHELPRIAHHNARQAKFRLSPALPIRRSRILEDPAKDLERQLNQPPKGLQREQQYLHFLFLRAQG